MKQQPVKKQMGSENVFFLHMSLCKKHMERKKENYENYKHKCAPLHRVGHLQWLSVAD